MTLEKDEIMISLTVVKIFTNIRREEVMNIREVDLRGRNN